ncbi:hypothetical protein ACH4PU_30610 [Streptomyces sp. NPDC021100]|uniref:hypothetical protein n=1 Tax=Streptomyces sp. NPDC021100 TaxID=3365114 RepID=UPI003790CC29
MSYRRYTDQAEQILESARMILNEDKPTDYNLGRANAAISMAAVYAYLARTAAHAKDGLPRNVPLGLGPVPKVGWWPEDDTDN